MKKSSTTTTPNQKAKTLTIPSSSTQDLSYSLYKDYTRQSKNDSIIQPGDAFSHSRGTNIHSNTVSRRRDDSISSYVPKIDSTPTYPFPRKDSAQTLSHTYLSSIINTTPTYQSHRKDSTKTLSYTENEITPQTIHPHFSLLRPQSTESLDDVLSDVSSDSS